MLSLLLANSCARQAAPAISPCDAQPNQVRAVEDLQYGPGGNVNSLDLYVPAHRAGEPVVVFAHGGGWVGGDRRSYGHVGQAFARCGIAFANVNYPLAPRANAAQQAAAILRAARWVQAHAALYGYAPDRMFLMGHSAGAELVSLAGLARAARGPGSAQRAKPAGPPLSGVIAVEGFAFDPPSDFGGSQKLPDLAHYYTAAFGRDQSHWQRFSATALIAGRPPPFVVVHGLDDTYVPAQDSQRFADALRSAGDAVTYLQPSGRDHNTVIGAVADDPGDPTAATIEAFIFSNGALPEAAHTGTRSVWAALAAALPSVAPALGKKLPRPDHVIVVMEENHSFSSVIGNRDAPYLNKLATQGALFTQSYAITHPSQPNYIALFAGQIDNNGDGCPERGVPPDAPNLGGELLAGGFGFVGYSETLPRPGFPGCWAGFAKWSYARKHSPWVNFTSVPPASNQPFSALPQFQNLPTVAFVIPNLAHDMHSGSLEDADAWLQHNLGPLVEWAATHNTLVIITWDEDDRGENNRIPTIFAGPMVKTGRYDGRIDHYSVLRTLEDMYGLAPAGHSREASSITNCWR